MTCPMMRVRRQVVVDVPIERAFADVRGALR